MSIDDLFLSRSIDKLKLFSKIFEGFSSNYKETCKWVEAEYNSISLECEKFIVEKIVETKVEKKFEQLAEDMTKLVNAQSLFREHLSLKEMEEKYENIKTKFWFHLQKSAEQLKPLLSKENLTQDKVNSLNSYVLVLESVKKTNFLHSHIDSK